MTAMFTGLCCMTIDDKGPDSCCGTIEGLLQQVALPSDITKPRWDFFCNECGRSVFYGYQMTADHEAWHRERRAA